MKKIIILASAITMMIGTAVFAQGDEVGVNRDSKNYVAQSVGRGRYHSRHCCENGRVGYVQNKEIEANRIAIMEKKVELRKEMIKETPDWNKVEKLNQEIATKRATNQTIRMRERMSNN